MAAASTVITGALMFFWLGRIAGRWVGLFAGALVTMLPQHGLVPDSFGRHGMLDPVAAMFMFASLVLAWFWYSSRGRRSWLFAVATGLAVGLAASAKETGFLAAPGVVLLGVLLAARHRQGVSTRLAQSVAAAVAAIAAFLLPYLPLGSPITAVRYMVHFQRAGRGRHPVVVAGHLYDSQPWWANFWFVYHGYGTLITVALVGLAGCAVILRHDRLTAYLGAALIFPVIFHSFLHPVTLPY